MLLIESWGFIMGVFLFSLLVGSFLNVVIYRLPVMMFRENAHSLYYFLYEYIAENKKIGLAAIDEGCPQCRHHLTLEDLGNDPASAPVFNLSWPPSSCPHCNHAIRFYENIPLVSYFLLLRGKCSQCKAAISLRYPLVEFVTASLSAVIAWYFGPSIMTGLLIFLCWGLICATMIDYDHKLLPDTLTLPLMWLGIMAANFGYLKGIQVDINSSLLGAAIGYLSLWSVYWVFKLMFKKEGMGYGDFKLLACLGAWFGVMSLPLIILLSSVLGATLGIFSMIVTKESTQKQIPFGPYLTTAALITLFWGADFNHWWLGF